MPVYRHIKSTRHCDLERKLVSGRLNSLALLTQRAALHNTRQDSLAAMAAQGLEPAVKQSVYFRTCADRQIAVNIHCLFSLLLLLLLCHRP